MAEVNEDLVQVLEANRASFAAAGPAFEEDVKLIDAKLTKVKGGKATTTETKTKTTRKTRKTTVKKGK
jgi:hypothetical protein